MQNSDVDDYADCDDDEDNVSMKMLKSATWHQAFHCVKETLDGVDDDIDSGATLSELEGMYFWVWLLVICTYHIAFVSIFLTTLPHFYATKL